MEVIKILNALLTPVIAIIATFIAYQQWNTNRQKLKLELYERRLDVYRKVVDIIGTVMALADITREELMRFRFEVSEAQFIFGAEIYEYINQIYDHGAKLNRWKREYRDSTQKKPKGNNQKQVLDNIEVEMIWFENQMIPERTVYKLFKKYLSISS